MTAVAALDRAAVLRVLGGVPDPEMPAVSVAELGMVVDARVVDERRVEVDLVATYSGCPAVAVIRDDVSAALRRELGVDEVEVRFVTSVVWTPDRISDAGRVKLREFGIAPPGSGQHLTSGAGGLVLVQLGALGAGGRAGVVCPYCGSTDTVQDSAFGPTPCRSSQWCSTCRQPFEAVKP